ncbi:MAG: ribonuclease III [Bacteroidaceae bacterium]|nr:ribonuclease III [Bacteroidaceae bacterium]
MHHPEEICEQQVKIEEYIITPIRLLFRRDRESYFVLRKILGFYPRDIKLYKQALTHKSSHMHDGGGHAINNERLEFLGDAILDAIVGDIVFRHFKGKKEGFLTNTRSKIVSRETLNQLAVEIGLDKLIQYQTHTNTHNSYMCGNAFEAFIGAIYLDRGYDRCMDFVKKRIIDKLINLEKIAYREKNFKSKLIEWSQKKRIMIEFELTSERKDSAYNPIFESRVLIEGIECGQGTGYSKKESQQLAAKSALKKVKKEEEIMRSILSAKEKRIKTEMEEVFVEDVEELMH